MASYSVFVLEPGQRVEVAPVCSDCSVARDWVFWLCVAFGFGFFVLLVVVVFLLSAVTCSCVSQVSRTLMIELPGFLESPNAVVNKPTFKIT